jgi:signal transduction histidine kinase
MAELTCGLPHQVTFIAFSEADAMKHPLPAVGSLLLVIAPLLVAAGRGWRRREPAPILDDASAALRRRIAELQAQVERLEHQARDAERERDEFLATLSHELRSPLNAMLGWIELLRVHLKDPVQQAHAIDVIERNARAEVRIIGDLLDLARLVTHRLSIERQPVSLRDVVQEAVDTMIDTAAAHAVSIRPDCPADVCAIGDRARLEQAIRHIVDNAVKFSDRGGTVRISLRCSGRTALIEVSDTGIGMGNETLSHVFDRFRQAERGLTRRYGGLGVGLTIARAIVELHGGTVEAASGGPGKGSTFTLRLPVGTAGPCLAH